MFRQLLGQISHILGGRLVRRLPVSAKYFNGLIRAPPDFGKSSKSKWVGEPDYRALVAQMPEIWSLGN